MSAPQHITAMAEAAMRPTIRDLMAQFRLALARRDNCLDGQWNEADRACLAAEFDLVDRLREDTGLTRAELRDLGGMI